MVWNSSNLEDALATFSGMRFTRPYNSYLQRNAF